MQAKQLKHKTYFTCVTYSGSTCCCRTRNHTNNECGHKHKTVEAAEKCLEKLRNWSKDGRSCSATWYKGKVAEREPEHNEEVWYADDGEMISAYDECTC